MNILALDLSTKSTGMALQKLNIETNKSELLIYKDITEKDKALGILKIYEMVKKIKKEIIELTKTFKLDGTNTIIIIEKRLSGFNKFTTNKTIETTAQLHYATEIMLLKELNFVWIDHISSLTWQNKLLNLHSIKKERKKSNRSVTGLSKFLSKKYVLDDFKLKIDSDDITDAICISEFYIKYKTFKNLNNKNTREKLHNNFKKTLSESFQIKGSNNLWYEKKYKTSISELITGIKFNYEFTFVIDDKLYVKRDDKDKTIEELDIANKTFNILLKNQILFIKDVTLQREKDFLTMGISKKEAKYLSLVKQ